jgi:exopolysaccharide biosynthesis polyprenyl glycosylphosphotransferase
MHSSMLEEQLGATRASIAREVIAMPDLDVAAAEGLPARSLRRWARRAAIGDLVAAAAAATVARIVRFGLGEADVTGTDMSYVAVGLVVALLWPVLVAFCGGYDQRVAFFGVEEIRRLARSAVTLLALMGIAHFLLQLDMSRAYIGLLLPIVVALSFLWRLVLRWRTGVEHRRGVGRYRTVAVGPADELARLVEQLRSRQGSAIDLVAVVVEGGSTGGHPALQDVERLPSREAIATLGSGGHGVDLLLRAGRPDADEMWSLARQAHELGVALATAPSRSDAANVAFSYVPLGSTPLLLVETPALKPTHRVAKAVFDRVGAALLLLVLSPILVGIALAIAIRDGRPILFRQERVGRDGDRFDVLKFRTMVPDAKERLAELHDYNEAEGPLFKIRDDPRITRTGGMLRRRSLDELPQLLNVLKGDMSLVGPRPPLASEVATYDERTNRRLVIKPGMTGLWQVEGRSDLPWDEGVYLDLLYVDHWSPLLDLVILVRTLRAVLRPSGAY